jgi:hypothetical protein
MGHKSERGVTPYAVRPKGKSRKWLGLVFGERCVLAELDRGERVRLNMLRLVALRSRRVVGREVGPATNQIYAVVTALIDDGVPLGEINPQ